MTDALSNVMVYGVLPLWLIVALGWLLLGAADLAVKIFERIFSIAPSGRPRWRPPGVYGVVSAIVAVAAVLLMIDRVSDRNDCDDGCSVFSDHRNDTASTSVWYLLVAAVLIGAVWWFGSRRPAAVDPPTSDAAEAGE